MQATLPVDAPAAQFYVAPSGSDTNPGTRDAPFQTILKASQAAVPGTTVHVASGTYYGGFSTAGSGAPSAPIRYVSDTKWGAKIVPAAGSRADTAWSVKGDYTEVKDFDVDGQNGPTWKNGIASSGSYNRFQGNLVHDIATDPAMCDRKGGSGLNATHYYHGVQVDMIGNVVHHIGSRGCKYIHGIYMATSGNVKNNLIYDIGGWGIHLWHDASDINIADNTIAGSGGGIIVGGGGFYSLTSTDHVNVANNIVYGNDHGIAERGVTGTHNTYTNNVLYANGGQDKPDVPPASRTNVTGTVNADPQFADAAHSNFQLKSGSPASGRGSTVKAPAAARSSEAGR